MCCVAVLTSWVFQWVLAYSAVPCVWGAKKHWQIDDPDFYI